MFQLTIRAVKHFFISRAGEDAEWGRWIADVLTRAGHHCFLQDYDMPHGSFPEHIRQGMESHPDFVAILSPDHLRKPHTRAELNASYAADPLGTTHTRLLVRVRDCEIPKAFAHLIYLDLRTRDDAAERILLAPLTGHRPTVKSTQRTFISKLPVTDPTVLGRDAEFARLEQAWADPEVNLLQIIAPGGTGKTALMSNWYRRHTEEATVFGWSFYSQGASLDRQASSDPFFADALRFFGITVEPTASVWAKAEALAARLREERVLLILDGMEPLQDADGNVRDSALKALLLELAVRNRGLVLCTTRVRIADVPDEAPRAESLDLDNLSPGDGARVLRHLKVSGADDELEQASREFGNHALALTLLGTYLADFCEGDVRRRVEIDDLFDEDGRHGAHARRVMQGYERMFAGRAELDVLRGLGYFDRPAEPEALKLVMPEMAGKKYQAALNRLHAARLILTRDVKAEVDCHPLVREHFGAVVRLGDEEAWRAGHLRLYEFYCGKAPHRPDTVEAMTPLFFAVGHGCRAGRHQEVVAQVYRDRIHRGGEFYLVHKVGAFGADLSLLAHFFENPWSRPVGSLSAADQVWVLGEAAFTLHALGRLGEAVAPMRAGAEAAVKRQSWTNAATVYSNLSGLLLTLGQVAEAIAAARQSVGYADRSSDALQLLGDRTTLADALHQAGHLAEAERLFVRAEKLQAELQPGHSILYSLWGYRYCDLLLGRSEVGEVRRRATHSLAIAQRNHWLLDIGLDYILLGRAHAPGSAESRQHLDEAVEFLRRSGDVDMLPLALLARGTDRDLEEVHRIASRSGMRLHLTDYHLAMARRHQSIEHLEKAEKLIQETGYHRRDAEAAALRKALTPRR